MDLSLDHPIDLVFYSDNCGGQQKNKFVLSMYVYALSECKNIKSITHKYLIHGHSQNEGDNVHSVIEKQVKRTLRAGPIYVPEHYATLIKMSKKNAPFYDVQELMYDDFFDLKSLQEMIGNNFNVDTSKEKVSWLDIKVMKLEKDKPNVFFFKTSYSSEEFKMVDIRTKKMKKIAPILKKAYSSKIQLSDVKKLHLMQLCKKKKCHPKGTF